MIAIDQLVRALRELSDEQFQRKAWLSATGPTVSSFIEQVSQVFDDTGLADVLDSGEQPAELTKETRRLLMDLDIAVQRVDQAMSSKQLLRDPRMVEVRMLARRALESIEVQGGRESGLHPD